MCWRQAAAAGAGVAGTSIGGRRCGGHDDRRPGGLQHEGQARTRMDPPAPVVAPGVRGGAVMTRIQEFEELRPLLFAIAYRILGSVGEAEDAVQEAWLRFDSSATTPTSTKAFLSAVV